MYMSVSFPNNTMMHNWSWSTYVQVTTCHHTVHTCTNPLQCTPDISRSLFPRYWQRVHHSSPVMAVYGVGANSELCFPLLLRRCMQYRVALDRDISGVDCICTSLDSFMTKYFAMKCYERHVVFQIAVTWFPHILMNKAKDFLRTFPWPNPSLQDLHGKFHNADLLKIYYIYRSHSRN